LTTDRLGYSITIRRGLSCTGPPSRASDFWP